MPLNRINRIIADAFRDEGQEHLTSEDVLRHIWPIIQEYHDYLRRDPRQKKLDGLLRQVHSTANELTGRQFDRAGDLEDALMVRLTNIPVAPYWYQPWMMRAAARILLEIKKNPDRNAPFTEADIDRECRRIRSSCYRRGFVF
jgi:hypothetical protein